MLLSEIFEHLTYGELSQLTITGNGTGIKPKDYPVMASHLNLALNAIHSRLPLREEEAVIQLYDNITNYYLRPQFAVSSGSSESIKYIIDTPTSKFNPEVIQVLDVYSENGDELPVNNLSKKDSIFLPTFDCIQVPYPVSDNTIFVIYRASHEKIVVNPSSDLEGIEVKIPAYLVSVISYFIASNLIAPMGENNIGEGNNYLAKYEAAIANIENQGLVSLESFNNNRIQENGWA